ncbi:hypothetical protein GCM10022236_42560 [Microlunatus ginsengisoli]|uniref:Uncharacterized protein n=1 Tax=Microlunatus ginsengisoli TaxID=363863 RepID=A0ABP7AME2_9ACTN
MSTKKQIQTRINPATSASRVPRQLRTLPARLVTGRGRDPADHVTDASTPTTVPARDRTGTEHRRKAATATLVAILGRIGELLAYPTPGYPGWYLGPAFYRYYRRGFDYPQPQDPAGTVCDTPCPSEHSASSTAPPGWNTHDRRRQPVQADPS